MPPAHRYDNAESTLYRQDSPSPVDFQASAHPAKTVLFPVLFYHTLFFFISQLKFYK